MAFWDLIQEATSRMVRVTSGQKNLSTSTSTETPMNRPTVSFTINIYHRLGTCGSHILLVTATEEAVNCVLFLLSSVHAPHILNTLVCVCYRCVVVLLSTVSHAVTIFPRNCCQLTSSSSSSTTCQPAVNKGSLVTSSISTEQQQAE